MIPSVDEGRTEDGGDQMLKLLNNFRVVAVCAWDALLKTWSWCPIHVIHLLEDKQETKKNREFQLDNFLFKATLQKRQCEMGDLNIIFL